MKPIILCVDDELDILRSLGKQLKRCFGKDYEVELASSGEEALTLCAELIEEGRHIPLIISDQQMPEMAGDTLLVQLHALYPKTLKIMLTGQADAKSVGNVVNAAALYRYISKPWDETDLILTVSEALRCFQQEQELIEKNKLLSKANEKLKSSLSLLLATLEATADGILVLDRSGKTITFNQKFAKIWNLLYAESSFHEDGLFPILAERLVESDADLFKELFLLDNTNESGFLELKVGSIIEYYLHPQQLNGEIVGRVWSFRDVTQKRQTATLIEHQAWHDALTNLPNRLRFNQELEAALIDAKQCLKLLAVMFLDLDRFKQVNDTFGHPVGDQLLQHVVQRLSSCLRQTDLLARWGGDEFIVLCPQIQSRTNVCEIAQRLVQVLQPNFFIDEHCLDVTASVGIALYPDDGIDKDTLLQNADVALYQAKRIGRNNYQYYDADATIAS